MVGISSPALYFVSHDERTHPDPADANYKDVKVLDRCQRQFVCKESVCCKAGALPEIFRGFDYSTGVGLRRHDFEMLSTNPAF